MDVRLIVIRTNQAEKNVEFYSLLGIRFVQHRHGNGPLHYSSQVGTTVFEMYPLAKDQAAPDKNIRLGFGVDHFENVLQSLKNHGVVFNGPVVTDFGTMTVVTDPDGRRVELYKK